MRMKVLLTISLVSWSCIGVHAEYMPQPPGILVISGTDNDDVARDGTVDPTGEGGLTGPKNGAAGKGAATGSDNSSGAQPGCHAGRARGDRCR